MVLSQKIKADFVLVNTKKYLHPILCNLLPFRLKLIFCVCFQPRFRQLNLFKRLSGGYSEQADIARSFNILNRLATG
ncbi:Uncharacterized protein dnm_062940 [Desulfonema magnum]|uniref:Uncharacterized protein n=1 Tax=Desulfonema magnum TaxID=45655 RepID=A0A975BR91_9BACT|nr:Uncharacterized protein dnm_062940 [Desulfonema magnum]